MSPVLEKKMRRISNGSKISTQYHPRKFLRHSKTIIKPRSLTADFHRFHLPQSSIKVPHQVVLKRSQIDLFIYLSNFQTLMRSIRLLLMPFLPGISIISIPIIFSVNKNFKRRERQPRILSVNNNFKRRERWPRILPLLPGKKIIISWISPGKTMPRMRSSMSMNSNFQMISSVKNNFKRRER